MRNHQLESRVRENRTHGSEGGESGRSFLPLSVGQPGIPLAFAGMTWLSLCFGVTGY